MRTVSVVFLGILLAGCATTPVPIKTPQVACLSQADVRSLPEAVKGDIEVGNRSLLSGDSLGALVPTRIAAANIRELADLVQPVDPVAASDLERSASALDDAMSALGDGDFPGATSLMRQGTVEITSALERVEALYC